MHVLKNIFSIFFILLLSTGIFLLVSQDKKVKQDILTTTLKMFGDDLLALVPEGEQHELIAKKFDEFIDKAESDQVDAEQIETVAATILNYSNSDKAITPEELITVLEVNMQTPSDSGHLRSVDMTPPPVRPLYRSPRPMTPKEKEELAKRLARMERFQSKVIESSRKDSNVRKFRQNIFFTTDSVIKVTIHSDPKGVNVLTHMPDIQRQINEMEKKELVQWVDAQSDSQLSNMRFHRDVSRLAHRMAGDIKIQVPDSLNAAIYELTDSLISIQKKINSIDYDIEQKKTATSGWPE